MALNAVERPSGDHIVAGAASQLTATIFEPDWGGDDVGRAAGVVARERLWVADPLHGLVGLVLVVAALTVVDHRQIRAASHWSRLGQPFLFLLGAFVGIAV